MVSRIYFTVLAIKVKIILLNVIFDTQSAFVSHQLIIDNTTVAFEVLHGMHNKHKGKIS